MVIVVALPFDDFETAKQALRDIYLEVGKVGRIMNMADKQYEREGLVTTREVLNGKS